MPSATLLKAQHSSGRRWRWTLTAAADHSDGGAKHETKLRVRWWFHWSFWWCCCRVAWTWPTTRSVGSDYKSLKGDPRSKFFSVSALVVLQQGKQVFPRCAVVKCNISCRQLTSNVLNVFVFSQWRNCDLTHLFSFFVQIIPHKVLVLGHRQKIFFVSLMVLQLLYGCRPVVLEGERDTSRTQLCTHLLEVSIHWHFSDLDTTSNQRCHMVARSSFCNWW